MNNADNNTYNNAFGARFSTSLALPQLLLIPLFTLFLFACSGEENVSGNNTNGFAFPQTEITKAIGNASFTVQASGGSGTGAILYTSDNPAIASVDEITGKITIVAKGTTTIRATKAADEIYPQATASLSLTVIDPIEVACTDGEIPTIAAGESGIIDALNIAKDNAGVTVICRYVSVAATGEGDGSSWEHAYGVEDLRTLTDVDDASANKKYIYLVKAGTYTPADENGSRETSFSLKNHVAITGGWSGTAFERGEKTIFSGDLNGDDDTDDNSYHVFKHADATSVDNSAILYGVTISAGNANGDADDDDDGGGMFNNNSHPVVSNTSFSGNSARQKGGGMYNSFGSSPVVSNTSFSGNTAADGGGMYNFFSHPVVSNTTFSGNSATFGGGMMNYFSHPVVSNTTFSDNSAAQQGGGMLNANNSHPEVSNSIFWGNTAASGNQIYIYDSFETTSGISLGSVVLEGGIGGIGKGEGVTYTNIKDNNIIENDPKLRDLDNNGGFVQTMALGDGSSAINEGLYIKRAADNRTYYYSADNTTWYATPLLDMAEGESGDEVVDGEVDSGVLLDKDARGYLHQGKPDIGAYESQGGS